MDCHDRPIGVFEDTTTLTNIFRNEIQEEINELTNDLAKTLASIKSFFKDFSNYPLSQVGEDQIDFITSAIEAVNTFSQESLTENINLAKNIEKALSSEGLRLLIVEKQELKLLIKSINRLLINCNTFFKLDSPQKSEDLNNKIKMQEILAEAVIPKDSNAEYFLSFLRATTSVCDFSSLEEPSCPLCKRPLGKEEVKLFNQYHKLISSQIEKDIATLQQEITTAKKILAQIHKTVPGEWDNYSTLPKEMLNQGKLYANAIIEDCKIANKHSAATEEHIKQLKALCLSGASQVLQKKQAIDLASKDRPSLERQLNKVNAEIEALMYAQLIQNKIDLLYRAKYLDAEISLLKSKLPSFTRLLRGITYSAKNAFEDLVVSDFEHRLNKEYLALAEQDISAFGVTLASRGSDAAVTVLPQIGGKEIENILSEGEQRLHSLALFFAETETSEHSVLVFDDPISSFDYKFTENYCIRLRDLALKHPDRQLIVLTHDWYFFIALQTKLNRANLNNDLSIYVLENCSHLGEYSEKIDDLKANILAILTSHGEPNNSEKETLAGNMRRLIESIINTHVFNKLRHQYRAKSQTVSAFGPYTKLVPLLEQEAHDLQDLYGKLSISAHDDPRNAYVNTNKATFQTRYDKIVDIESAIIGRK